MREADRSQSRMLYTMVGRVRRYAISEQRTYQIIIGPNLTTISRRARPEAVSDWRGALYRVQAV